MRILLLRHGATDWNVQGRCQGASDIELNETGLRQAEEAATALSTEAIDAVYSSNLKRARQTARLVSLPHNLAVTIEDGMRELDHGALEGLTFDEIKQRYPEFISKWRSEPAELQIPGGERLIEVARRAWDGLNRIVQRHSDGQTVVVVSHNFPILSILCRVTDTPLDRYRSFHVDPCSVTRLSRDDLGEWRVSHVNNQVYVAADSPLQR